MDPAADPAGDTSYLSESENESRHLTSSKSHSNLFSGVSRGLKKITPSREDLTNKLSRQGSVSQRQNFPHEPPPSFVIKRSSPPLEKPVPSLPQDGSWPSQSAQPPQLLSQTQPQSQSQPSSQHARNLSLQVSLEKPLPEPPSELSPDTLSGLPLHNRFLTPSASYDSLVNPDSLSTTSGMDPSSADKNYRYGTGNGPETLMNNGHLNPADDGRDNLTPKSNGPQSGAHSPQTQQQSGRSASVSGPSGAAAAAGAAGAPAPSAHLSGLMCNVHRTTGHEPHPLVGATTTILGDKLYVFGGRILSRSRPASLTADLFELDLIRRHWTKIDATGDIPPPRYFHSMCALGDSKMVCYGGMSPQPNAAGNISQDQQDVTVMSDIYIYDVPTKKWTYVKAYDSPQGRYAHCACILPSSATFSSHRAPLSALQHNPASGANEGRLGVNIDGTGGAEMIVVGGQDGANHYIEQISVFNLRSLKWTSTEPLGKSCGAYRSVVAPLPPAVTARIGKPNGANGTNIRPELGGISQEAREPGTSMLIYSNYNFLDVKLELQIRSPDGSLTEKRMSGSYTPPGLRFPNGGVIDTHFVVSGTYLTSSKQEYALWALDLRSLTWSRIDAGGSVFSQGSWNRGVLWNRRNTFVILGNRKRSLVDDYNHRRINFTNVCMVELEAFGFYDNPRKTSPMSGFVSASSPYTNPSLSLARKAGSTGGGRFHSRASEELGEKALAMRELADMDILCIGGERIPVNSRIVARRWGPYFVQLLREGTLSQDGTDIGMGMGSMRSASVSGPSGGAGMRNSSLTITPSSRNTMDSLVSTGSSVVGPGGVAVGPGSVMSGQTPSTPGTSLSGFSPPGVMVVDPATINTAPTPRTLPPNSRPRCLYVPHTYLTMQAMLHFLYTSSLPPLSSPLCTPQILCSLLQVARPYRVDGLLEAVVERLHTLLDSRNAAAVFNATAMAAGGGRGIDGTLNPNFFLPHGGLDMLSPMDSEASSQLDLAASGMSGASSASGLSNGSQVDGVNGGGSMSSATASTAGGGGGSRMGAGLRINTSVAGSSSAGHPASEELSATTGSVSGSEWSSSELGDNSERGRREVWSGELSSVIGLQKRGLKGLMEGRRLRERTGTTAMMGGSGSGRVGLGIATGGA